MGLYPGGRDSGQACVPNEQTGRRDLHASQRSGERAECLRIPQQRDLDPGPAVPGGNLEPTIYRITVRGRLTKRLMSAFEGLNVEPGIEQTTLVGEIRDQSHLYGVLDLMRELGLDLVRVETNRGTSGPDDEESAR